VQHKQVLRGFTDSQCSRTEFCERRLIILVYTYVKYS
jgi:hypothetical protein